MGATDVSKSHVGSMHLWTRSGKSLADNWAVSGSDDNAAQHSFIQPVVVYILIFFGRFSVNIAKRKTQGFLNFILSRFYARTRVWLYVTHVNHV